MGSNSRIVFLNFYNHELTNYFAQSSQGGKDAKGISQIHSTFGGIKEIATNSRILIHEKMTISYPQSHFYIQYFTPRFRGRLFIILHFITTNSRISCNVPSEHLVFSPK